VSGRFISFEGIDGAGKSTQIAAIAKWLRDRGDQVLLTREPGGTPLAEELRSLVLSRSMDALTEVLLMFAGRRDHLETVIAPALLSGVTVLCDRFTDSSFAYQGGGRGIPRDVLEPLANWVQEGREPDLTLWFDLPPAMAAARRSGVRDADRIEAQQQDFFERVRAGFAARAKQAPERVVRIDASVNSDKVWEQVVWVLHNRFPK
jgi:dTMP kinase